MTKSEILIKSANFRGLLGYSEVDPIDIIEVLNKLGIITFFSEFSSTFSGMSIKSEGNSFVLINSKHPIGRQNFSIAHELYHLYIQKDPIDEKKKSIEKEADFFAKCFLIPKVAISSFLQKNNLDIDENSVVLMEQYFQVSRQALLYALGSYRLVNDDFILKLKDNVQGIATRYVEDLSLYNSGRQDFIVGDYLELAKKLYDRDDISEPNYLSLIRK